MKPSTVSSTYVKLRVWSPSPWISIASPLSSDSMKVTVGPPHQVRWFRGP
jgi:hypothetical protein